MSDPNGVPMFAAPKSDERSFPTVPVAIAAAVVLVVIAAALLIGRHDGADAAKLKTLQPPAAYADNLPVSGVQMSEATSYSGAKVLYLDGHLANTGNATVNDVTVQVIFGNIVGEAPKVETTPLMLIRAREPYVDVEPVSAGPIAPGTSADFRLTFERVDPNWDQQLPEVRVVRVSTK